jgi:hypothetical protein|eukprot:SAG25_NODE_1438_length_3023_cov_1.870041_7_plen_52_part_00
MISIRYACLTDALVLPCVVDIANSTGEHAGYSASIIANKSIGQSHSEQEHP